jgi:hypothetical protein
MKNDAVCTGMHNRVVANDRYVARRTNPLFTRETTGIETETETEEGLGVTATATPTLTATATTGVGINNGEGDASVHDIDVVGIHDIAVMYKKCTTVPMGMCLDLDLRVAEQDRNTHATSLHHRVLLHLQSELAGLPNNNHHHYHQDQDRGPCHPPQPGNKLVRRS